MGVGANIPVQFQPTETTVPLPSQEEDWTFGYVSNPPSYYPLSKIELSKQPHELGKMSLLGAKMSIQCMWGKVARYICGLTEPPPPINKNAAPWDTDSLFDSTQKHLAGWLGRLSDKQKWSVTNLIAYKNSNLDLVGQKHRSSVLRLLILIS
jgi:hypothetical protein